MNLHIIDYICIFGYLGFIIILGSSFVRGTKSTKNYFLADKSINWLPLSISMYVSIFSAISFVMAPAEAFRGDLQYLIALALYPMASVFAIIFFVDIYTRLQITTKMSNRHIRNTTVFCEFKFDSRWYKSPPTLRETVCFANHMKCCLNTSISIIRKIK